MEATEKDLKRYLSPKWTAYLGTILIGLLLLLMLLGPGLRGEDLPVGGLVLLAIIGLLFSVKPLFTLSQIGRIIQREKDVNRLDRMLNDYQNSLPLCGDKVKTGQEYIFGKNVGSIVRYDEITKVYQYIHKTNFAEDKRQLKADIRGGGTKVVCNLKLKGKDDEELKKLLAVILSKNPEVKVGYH